MGYSIEHPPLHPLPGGEGLGKGMKVHAGQGRRNREMRASQTKRQEITTRSVCLFPATTTSPRSVMNTSISVLTPISPSR